MRGIGDEHLDAFRVAARFMIGAHDEHTREFSMCTRRGLKRHRAKPLISFSHSCS